MSKGGKTETVTTAPDPQTQQRNDWLWKTGQAIATDQPGMPQYNGQRVAGIDPRTDVAYTGFNQMANLGMGGMNALAGDPQATAQLMNPHQQQVINALGGEYDRARSQAALGANDAATQAGAFGGDRHALMVGERQGALDRQQMGDTANLLHQGFNDAMGRAGQLANFGMGGLDRSFNAGDYNRQVAQQNLDVKYGDHVQSRDWRLRNLGIMQSLAQGMPTGQTQSTPQSRNAMGGIIGGAAAGGSIGGPLGAGIGAGFGLLGGLF
jgi:hypothetical protein